MKKQDLYLFIGMIILIAVIFVVYLVASLFGPTPEPEESPIPSTIPTRSTQPLDSINPSPLQSITTPLPSLTGQTAKDQVINSLPLITSLFNVEYYYDGDVFRITIKQNPYTENKLKAEQWLKDQGLNPASLNIFWDAYPEVKR